MKRTVTHRIIKWTVIAVCLAVVAICGVTTESLAVGKRGVVIGLGVDWHEKGYTVCAQMLQAGAGNSPDTPAMYEVVVGEGATLREAMADVTKKTSLFPSYAHCKVLFVGDSLLTDRLDGLLVQLMQGNDLGNVQVVAVEGSAYQAITATVAILPTSSAYIERDNLLISKFGGRRLLSLKDYCQRIDGVSGNKFLPYAVSVPAEKPTGGEESTKQEDDVVLYDVLNTVAFDSEGKAHVYGNEITRSVGLVETKGGQFTAYTEDGRYVTVKINGVKRRRTYRPRTVIGHYTFEVGILEQTLVADGEPKARDVEALVALRMDEAMQRAYETCLADGVDIFSVTGRLYKRYGEVLPLEACTWRRKIEVKCK